MKTTTQTGRLKASLSKLQDDFRTCGVSYPQFRRMVRTAKILAAQMGIDYVELLEEQSGKALHGVYR